MSKGNGSSRHDEAADNLPHDMQSEMELLGLLLAHDDLIPSAKTKLSPPDFYDLRHRAIFTALVAMCAAGEPVLTSTVVQRFLAQDEAKVFGGVGYMEEVLNNAPAPGVLDFLMSRITSLSTRRRMIDGAAELIKAAAAWDSRNPRDNLDAHIRQANSLLDMSRGLGTPKSGHDIIAMPNLINLEDVVVRPVRWLWVNRIPIGKLTLIAGDPGLGKSFLTLDLAARVSRGRPWPDASTADQRHADEPTPRGVLLISAEDDPDDTIVPRLNAAGADVSRIKLLKSVIRRDPSTNTTIHSGFDLTDVDALRAAVKSVPDCAMVVVDPLSAYLGNIDSHSNAEVRALLAPMCELASEEGFALVVVSHLNKGDSTNAIYRITGSLAFAAAARAVWGVVRDKDNRDRRLFLPVKCNISGDQQGLAYSVVLSESSHTTIPSCVWESEPVSMGADDAFESQAKPRISAAIQEAQDFLLATLANGPRSSSELIVEAKAAGINRGNFDRARLNLRIKPYRDGFSGPWLASLPQ